jgi:hypothetical protein
LAVLAEMPLLAWHLAYPARSVYTSCQAGRWEFRSADALGWELLIFDC